MKSPYNLPVSARTLAMGAGLSLFALSASVASAQLIAYEGIDNPLLLGVLPLPDGSALSDLPATGSGFVDNWTPTSKSQGSSSHYDANISLTYPVGTGGDLPGTEKSGGVAVVSGDWDDGVADGFVGGNSFYRLNLGVAEALAANSAGKLYLSYLTMSLSPDGSSHANQGIRIPELAAANNNNSLGLIGQNRSDDWAAWGFKDTHGLDSGADASQGETDFVVVEMDLDLDKFSFWVNPKADGTSEGYASFYFTDGGNPKQISYYAFGAEGGQGDYMPNPAGGPWIPNPDGRPNGAAAYDEIRVGLDLYSVLGRETIPEPSLIGFLGFGFVGMLLAFRRRRA